MNSYVEEDLLLPKSLQKYTRPTTSEKEKLYIVSFLPKLTQKMMYTQSNPEIRK